MSENERAEPRTPPAEGAPPATGRVTGAAVAGHRGQVRGAPSAGDGTPVRLVRILVVEDAPCVRSVIREMLELNGYLCDTAADGVEGLARVREEGLSYDLVYSNLDMPRMNGDAFLAAIRPLLALRVPRILGSGHHRSHFAPMALSAGACDILEYPFELEEFLGKVSWALQVGEAYARLSDAPAPEEEPAYLFRWNLEFGASTGLYRLPVLLDLLDGADPAASRAACAALGGLAALSTPRPAWVEGLLTSTSPLVRVQAARAIGCDPGGLVAALRVLKPALGHSSPRVSDLALSALRQVLSIRHRPREFA